MYALCSYCVLYSVYNAWTALKHVEALAGVARKPAVKHDAVVVHDVASLVCRVLQLSHGSDRCHMVLHTEDAAWRTSAAEF